MRKGMPQAMARRGAYLGSRQGSWIARRGKGIRAAATSFRCRLAHGHKGDPWAEWESRSRDGTVLARLHARRTGGGEWCEGGPSVGRPFRVWTDIAGRIPRKLYQSGRLCPKLHCGMREAGDHAGNEGRLVAKPLTHCGPNRAGVARRPAVRLWPQSHPRLSNKASTETAAAAIPITPEPPPAQT